MVGQERNKKKIWGKKSTIGYGRQGRQNRGKEGGKDQQLGPGRTADAPTQFFFNLFFTELLCRSFGCSIFLIFFLLNCCPGSQSSCTVQ
jgi:hypothetical protein